MTQTRRSTKGLQLTSNEIDANFNGLQDLTDLALGTGVATFLGTPSSANLLAALTDETGTGAAVFANTPTLVTPVIGAATGTSLVLSSSVTSPLLLPVTPDVDNIGSASPNRWGTIYVRNIDSGSSTLILKGAGSTALTITGANVVAAGTISCTTFTATTSVVTPKVESASGASITLSPEGTNRWTASRLGTFPFAPAADGTQDIGTTSARILNVFTTIVDSASGTLILKGAGTTAVTITGAAVVTASSITTSAPAGGTAGAWKFGVAATVSPSAQNRTIELDVGGTIYYLSAKTTND